MVRVVVGDGDAVFVPEDLEAAVRSVKTGKGRGEPLRRDAQLHDGRAGRHSVYDVVTPRDVQLDAGQLFAAPHEIEPRHDRLAVDIPDDVFGIIVVLRLPAEGYHRLFDARKRLPGVFVVAVCHNKSARQLREAVEGADGVLDALEIFHVVGVHVEYQREIGVQFEEGVDELARLADHVFAFPGAPVSADDVQLAADDYGRVKAILHQYLGDHRGGGRLAVGAGDADRLVKFRAYRPQQHRALHHRYPARLCGDKLGVVRQYCRRVDYQVGPGEIFRPVAHMDRHAHPPLGVERVSLVVVRAGYGISSRQQYLRQREHPRAADTYEMYVFFSFQKFPCGNIRHKQPPYRAETAARS